MKVIINGRFYSQRITGVQRYARELVAQLDLLCDTGEIELALPAGVQSPVFKNIRTVLVGRRQGVVWEQTEFSRYVRKQKAVSLNLCNSAPLRGQKIVCIHDVKIRAYPEFFSWKFRMWYSFLFRNFTKKARAILTVSEFSKQEIIRYYHCNSADIHVIYNAWQHFADVPVSGGISRRFQLEKGAFAFALGSLEPNKNLKWIFEVARNNPSTVFAVGGGINRKIFSRKEIVVPENVRLLGYLSDTESKSLMKDCRIFFFPSFYEGFGIPPMEAMVAGTEKIVVSDIPVMHELFGKSVAYIDPEKYDYRLDELAGGIGNREETLNRFSWEKSAKRVLAIIKNLGERP